MGMQLGTCCEAAVAAEDSIVEEGEGAFSPVPPQSSQPHPAMAGNEAGGQCDRGGVAGG